MNAANNRSYLAGRDGNPLLDGKYGDTENPAQWNGWRVLAGGDHHAIPEWIPTWDTR